LLCVTTLTKVLLASLLLPQALMAQDTLPLVDEPAVHYYDFFEGTWYRLVEGKPDTTGFRFVVQRGVHPGAWLEQWVQPAGGMAALSANAIRTWDKLNRRWMYVWVSGNGLFQVWDGRTVGDDWYIFREFDIQGDRYLSRQAWLPDGPGRLVRVSERSDDGGRTWRPRFRQEYQRLP
jgi:hypothetical protein